MSALERFDADGLQYIWSANSYDISQECLYKYYLTYIAGWRSRSPSPHLLFGGWYAAALEFFHRQIAQGVERDDALRAAVLQTLTDTWDFTCEKCKGRRSIMIDPRDFAAANAYGHVDWAMEDCDRCGGAGKVEDGGRPWESDHNLKTRPNLIRSIVWYIDHFNPDPLTVVTLANGEPAVELEFMLEIGGGFMWRGKIDRLVYYEGDPYVQDQKTSGSTLGPYFFDQFDLSNQMSGYTFAGKIAYNIPVKGVIIDAVQIAVGFSDFRRGFTFRSDAWLNGWHKDVVSGIESARRATAERRWPMNLTSCSKYGGCVFRRACARSPEVREQFLLAEFTREPTWHNPMENR